MQATARLLTGNISQRCQILGIYPLVLASLVLGCWLGGRDFPGGFDWQYQVMTSLTSSRDNPMGYRIFCLGLGLACFLIVPSAGYFQRRLRHAAPRAAGAAAVCLRVGVLSLVGACFERGVVRDISPTVPLSHQLLTIVGIGGILWGLVGFSVAWIISLRHESNSVRKLQALLMLLANTPILGAGGCLLYLYLVPNDLGWVDPSWRALGVPVYLSFAFWEWLITFGFLVQAFALVLLLPAQPAACGRAPAEDARQVLLPTKHERPAAAGAIR